MVSVVIPVYNVAPYIDECLDSVVKQSYGDWECILVDDGSTDGSAEKCDDWTARESRVRVEHQSNMGVSAARNRGMDLAQGEYLVFIDSDDRVGETYLQKLVDAPKADIVVSGVVQELMNGTCQSFVPTCDKTITLTADFVEDYVELNRQFLLYGPVAKLYNLSLIRDYDIHFPAECSYGEDLLFNLDYQEHVHTISQVASANYYYRRGNDTLSTRIRPNQFRQDYEQWQRLRDFHERHGLWLESAKEMLYERLWGIVYDGIFSVSTSNQEILSIPEIRELRAYKHVFHCSEWIKWCILHRMAFVFKKNG